MKYTKEQMEHMLEYAKKWYPEGTRFICAEDGIKESVVQDDPLRFYPKHDCSIDAFGIRFICYEGKWAKIIDGPQPPPYIPLGTVINYEIY